jgi:hypothetical protein
MSQKIIAEYSDYELQTLDFFADAIDKSLSFRDLPGLTNGRVQKINVMKEHPIVAYMASTLSPERNVEPRRAGIVPAIGVTPGNSNEEFVVLGEAQQSSVLDDDYISYLKVLRNTEISDRVKDGFLTDTQIDNILSAYKRKGDSYLRRETISWGWDEEVNISCWTESTDEDSVISKVVDSILARMKVGNLGDDSKIRKMKYKPTRGLTNFNFGRVLYGTEFNLTFFNTYNSYTVYQEEHITDVEFVNTFTIPNAGEQNV